MAKNANNKKLNTRVAINRIKIDSLPSVMFTGKSDIVLWGLDNLYPSRIIEAIKKSPTALGCVKRQSEFIYGNGFNNGDFIVNRDGETLNDVAQSAIRNGYSDLYGFGLHFNFNIFGQITEIFHVNAEHIRKTRTLKQAEYGLWKTDGTGFWDNYNIVVDLFGAYDPVERIREVGIDEYKGQLLFWGKGSDIYPTSPLDSAIISASFEKEAQIYPYANIRNGFSGTTLLKVPTMRTGTEAEAETDAVTNNILAVSGAENAGGTLVISTPVDNDGKANNNAMIEHFSLPNADNMFVNQNAKAEGDILKVYGMPRELLGQPKEGSFSKASYYEAFDYKNSDTEFDRKVIERIFNKIMVQSIWSPPKLELMPLKLTVTE